MGLTCDIDVNECEKHPCGSGATCINEAGSFRCVCPPDLTGASCGDPLYSNSIISSLVRFTKEEIIIFSLAALSVLVLLIVGIIYLCRRKRKSNHLINNINNDPRKDMVINSVGLPGEHQQYKRGSKMSNLEIMQQNQQRPVSYTPSSNNDHTYTYNTVLHQYNNLDTLRSYGSAGDELENVPPEYRKLNRPNQQVNINNGNTSSDTESVHKQKWCEQIQMQTFTDNKINNDIKRITPSSLEHSKMMAIKGTSGVLPGRLLNLPSPTMMMSQHHSGEDGAYHWDCSDWVRRSHNPLPNITEVPGSEVPDSSSFHSNESNESHSKNNGLPPSELHKNFEFHIVYPVHILIK